MEQQPLPPTTRRNLLRSAACGFGYLAFAGLAQEAAAAERSVDQSPLAPRMPHFAPKAKRVIFMFMDGGPSHMETFDYKPKLNRDDGKAWGRNKKLYGSTRKFRRWGESGLWISDMYPELAARHADDLCVIRSMQTDTGSHPQAVPFWHTGSFQFVRPSIGSWILYGLGTENQDLPGFITINPPKILGGARNYGSAFLPAAYQGTRIGWMGRSVKNASIDNLAADHASDRLQRQGQDVQIEGAISSLELGARMKHIAPRVMDVSQEDERTRELYGIGQSRSDNFGRQCLMARRFVESGVRFVQMSHTNWDQHRNLSKALQRNSDETDRPIAGLLTDLKQRGLLEETLVIWGGEFGRKPEIQNGDGRGHNPNGFSIWMAGGGVKGGLAYGRTDEYGNRAVENEVHLHDLHATILHLLGLNHKELTYRHAGRDFRLTDVHGHVVHGILT